MYRKDLLDKHQIEVPSDLDGYLKAVQAID